MSESDSPTRGGLHQAHTTSQQLHQTLSSSSSLQNSAEERDDANNSIIGKVKSRVSSIFPQKLTQWFSPSTATTATTTSNGGVCRRRRRNEDDDREYEERGNNNNTDEEDSEECDGNEDASPTTFCPPSKRSRLNVEVTRTNFKDSQSLISSTPTTIGRQRISHLNLYGKSKDPVYNFSQTKTATGGTLSNLLTTNNLTSDSATNIMEVFPERNLLNTSISSRRSLNIPSTSVSSEGYRNLHNLKRQPVASVRSSGTSAISSSSSLYTPQRMSTNILEVDNGDDVDDDDDNVGESEDHTTQAASTTMVVEEVDEDDEEDADDDNEESEEIAKVTSKKKRKFTNGNLVGRSSSVATESGESRSSSVAQVAPPKSGLFNPANRGLRTLSGNGLNFYSHLEGRKSLFSEKNMPSALNNSSLSLTSLNRRQFNSSIYGSTSALSDSRLLNTSSPFYKGPTTYGGAAAYNKFTSTLNPSVRIAPTRIRPTSSLSSLSSSSNSLAQVNDPTSTTISSTAKRILELINDFSSPLNDAKKMASSIKTPAMIASRGLPGKRFSEADLANSRSMRLSTVRTPYSRPSVTLTPTNNDSKKLMPPLKELQVPSMSQLMQMKKMQTSIERARKIAHSTPTALRQDYDYKLPDESDTSATNNKNANKHVNKVKQKVTSSTRVSSKAVNIEDEEAPPPVNLPNIPFPFMSTVPKIDLTVTPDIPAEPAAKTNFPFGSTGKAPKPTNNFTFNIAAKPVEAADTAKQESTSTTRPEVNFKFDSSYTTSTLNTQPTTTAVSITSNDFKFSSPLSVGCAPAKGDLTPINNFKFSSPVMVGGVRDVEKVVTAAEPKSPASTTTVPQLKAGSVLDVLKRPPLARKVAPVAETSAAKVPTSSATGFSGTWGKFAKSANEWECSECMIRNKDSVDKCIACTTPRYKPTEPQTVTKTPPVTTQSTSGFFPIKNTFGDAFKPKADTWECSACMVRNKNDANECVACNTKKPGGSSAPTGSPAKLQTTDSGFKALVAEQTSSKWECDACMTRNEAQRNKCICCEQAKPGTQVVTDTMPKFSFGTTSASKFTFGFGNDGAKKEEELKAEASNNSADNKSGFTFGIPPVSNTGLPSTQTTSSGSSTGFTFGITPLAKSTSTTNDAGKDVPDVVKTNPIGFKFGVSPAGSSKSDAPTTTTATATGFSFGIKSTDAKPSSSVKFNLPIAVTETKTDRTSTATASTASSSTSSSSTATVAVAGTATTSPFRGFGGSSFGSTTKTDESKSVPAAEAVKPTGFLFGVAPPTSSTASAPASTQSSTASSATSQPLTTTQPITFGNSSLTDNAKSSPKFVFGSPAVGAAVASSSANRSSTGSQEGCSPFGSTTAATTIASSSSVFPVFGSPVSSSSSIAFKNPTPIFGASAATSSTASTAVSSSSSSPGFVFGKAATTTPLFGANSATSTTGAVAGSSSLGSVAGGFKSPQFADGAAAPSPSTNPSTISSTFNATKPFVFGSGTALNASAPGVPAQSSSKPFGSGTPAAGATTTASSWPATNTFSFGSPKLLDATGVNNPTPAPPPAFGPSSAFVFGQGTSIFGSNQSNESKPAATPLFGSATPAAPAIIGANATQSQQSTGNVFGSANSAPIFGSMSFGTAPAPAQAPTAAPAANNLTATPTFGSLGSSSFSSGFGSLAASSSTISSDGASAPKKAEPAFNFGSGQSAPSTGGFNFGSNNNNKPLTDSAFKFSTGTTPNFNFTGSTESSATAAQPFQFGAPTNTPAVFNFGGVETTNTGGPFQFNAAAPAAATNNIFAPLPTQGSQASSQQAARRKMRTTIRRITPR